jgi:integrase
MAKHRGHGEGTIQKKTTKHVDGSKVIKYQAFLPSEGDGKHGPYLGTFATRYAAQEALRAAIIAQAQGTLSVGKVPTLKAWSASWLGARPNIAYNTRKGYENSYDTMMPYIGNATLDKLQETDIAQMWRKLHDGIGADGKPRRKLAWTTLDKCHRHLTATFRAAVKNRQVQVWYNPASAEEAHPPKGTRQPINPLSEMEAGRLLDATRGTREHALFVTLMKTGIRHGEAQAIRWSNLDFREATLAVTSTLHQEKGKGWVDGGQTKTKRDRVIELRPDTVEVLRLHKICQAEARLKAGSLWEDRGLVFTTDVGKALDQRFIQRTLDKACEHAEIPRRTIKELRHTYATLALIEDVPVKIVSEALGHATTNITQEIYLHVVKGLQRDRMSHLDRIKA